MRARRKEPRPVPGPVSGQLGTKPAGIYVTSAMAATVCVNRAGRYLAGRPLQG